MGASGSEAPGARSSGSVGAAADAAPIVRSGARPRSERLGALQAAVRQATNVGKRGRGGKAVDDLAEEAAAAKAAKKAAKKAATAARAAASGGKRGRPRKITLQEPASDAAAAPVPHPLGNPRSQGAAVAAAGVAPAPPAPQAVAAAGDSLLSPSSLSGVRGLDGEAAAAGQHESRQERAARQAQLRAGRGEAGSTDGGTSLGGGGDSPSEPDPDAAPQHESAEERAARRASLRAVRSVVPGPGEAAEEDAGEAGDPDHAAALAALASVGHGGSAEDDGGHGAEPTPLAPPEWTVHPEVKEARQAALAASAMQWWASKRGDVLNVLLPALEDALVIRASSNSSSKLVKLAVALSVGLTMSSQEIETVAAAARGVGGELWTLLRAALLRSRDDEVQRRKVMVMLPLALQHTQQQLEEKLAHTRAMVETFGKLEATHPLVWGQIARQQREQQQRRQVEALEWQMLEREERRRQRREEQEEEWRRQHGPGQPWEGWEQEAGVEEQEPSNGRPGDPESSNALMGSPLSSFGELPASAAALGPAGHLRLLEQLAAAAAAPPLPAPLPQQHYGSLADGASSGRGGGSGGDGADGGGDAPPPDALTRAVRLAAEYGRGAASPSALVERAVALSLALTSHEPQLYLRQYLPAVAAAAAAAAAEEAQGLDAAVLRIVEAAAAYARQQPGAIHEQMDACALALVAEPRVLDGMAEDLEALAAARRGLAAAVRGVWAARGAMVTPLPAAE